MFSTQNEFLYRWKWSKYQNRSQNGEDICPKENPSKQIGDLIIIWRFYFPSGINKTKFSLKHFMILFSDMEYVTRLKNDIIRYYGQWIYMIVKMLRMDNRKVFPQ